MCGGACSMPAQIGGGVSMPTRAIPARNFRADGKDLKFFQAEVGQLTQLLEDQAQEIPVLPGIGSGNAWRISPSSVIARTSRSSNH